MGKATSGSYRHWLQRQRDRQPLFTSVSIAACLLIWARTPWSSAWCQCRSAMRSYILWETVMSSLQLSGKHEPACFVLRNHSPMQHVVHAHIGMPTELTAMHILAGSSQTSHLWEW